MSKTFVANGTGNQQTLSELDSDKIPVYSTEADLDTDLANLADGELALYPSEGAEMSLPVDEVESGNLHAVTSNAVADSLSYSTTEQKTGGTWIDGKPIYRVTFQTSVQGAVQTLLGEIANISEMVHTYGNIKQTGGSNVPIPYYMNATDYAVAFCVLSNGYAYATSAASGVATVTFEYTKTTD